MEFLAVPLFRLAQYNALQWQCVCVCVRVPVHVCVCVCVSCAFRLILAV